MARAFIPTIFDTEELNLRPLSSLLEQWGSPFSRQSEVAIYEDDDAFYVDAPMPGVLPEEMKVSLKEGVLYISGEKKEKKESMKVHRRLSSKFFYQLSLPQPIDESGKVEAEAKNGILTVRLPKARAAKPLKIEVKSS